jgi:hypothetical protein
LKKKIQDKGKVSHQSVISQLSMKDKTLLDVLSEDTQMIQR